MERHVAVEFGVPGMPTLHFRADADAAKEFADDMHRQGPGRKVTIDNRVMPGMEELPCQRLFKPDHDFRR